MRKLISCSTALSLIFTLQFASQARAEELAVLASSEASGDSYTAMMIGEAIGKSLAGSSVFTAANPVAGTLLIMTAVGTTVFSLLSAKAHAEPASVEARMVRMGSLINAAAARTGKKVSELSLEDLEKVQPGVSQEFKDLAQVYQTALQDPSLAGKVNQGKQFTTGELAGVMAAHGLMVKHGLLNLGK